MVRNSYDGKGNLSGRVVVEGKSITDRVEIPKKEKRYLKRIGEEILSYGALDFPEALYEFPPKISVSYMHSGHYKYDKKYAINRSVNICPYEPADEICEIGCHKFDHKVGHLTADKSGVFFYYRNAAINISYDNNIIAMMGKQINVTKLKEDLRKGGLLET